MAAKDVVILDETTSRLNVVQTGDSYNLPADTNVTGDFAVTGTIVGKDKWNVVSATGNVVANNGYFADTSSSAITLTLPASPKVGDAISFEDYASSFATNNLTIGRNGNLIMGLAEDMTVSTDGESFTLVWSGATEGWRVK